MRLRPAVSFFGPYRVYLPDEFLDTSLDSGLARVKAVAAPADSVQGASQMHGQNIEIPHDIFGFAGRTRYYVILEEPTVDSEQIDWKQIIADMDHALVGKALQAVNRVLTVYRDQDVSQLGDSSFHVIELIREDISDIHLVMITDNEEVIDGFAVTFPAFRTMGFGTAVARPDAISDSIRTLLATNEAIPIERELISSARNHLWRNQLRLVAVEANTAFEAFAFKALKAIEPASPLSDASGIFEKLKALEVVISAAAHQKGIKFAPWFDKSVDGWKGLLSAELIAWHKDCYELRNKVVHRGFNAVQKPDAKRALDSTEAAIQYLAGWQSKIVA